jgi:hypothetical protein
MMDKFQKPRNRAGKSVRMGGCLSPCVLPLLHQFAEPEMIIKILHTDITIIDVEMICKI